MSKTTLYKLTDQRHRTYGDCLWGEGVTVTTDGLGGLCGSGYTHWYLSPELAVLLNPIHGDYRNPVLWEGEGEIVKRDHMLKVGCTEATTLKIIPQPTVTENQRILFAILCAKGVIHARHNGFLDWADNWLSGADRTHKTALDLINDGKVQQEICLIVLKAASSLRPDYAAQWVAEAAWESSRVSMNINDFPLDLVAIAKLALGFYL